MKKSVQQQFHIFLTLLTILVVISSFYLQYQVGLSPCPLCIMQRICALAILTIFILSFWFFKNKTRLIYIFLSIFASAGLFFALRQLWLQSLPIGQIPACLPGFDVMIQYVSWQILLKALFWGSGDCSEVNWSMWGLSLPAWSALYFLFVLLANLWALYSSKNTIDSV